MYNDLEKCIYYREKEREGKGGRKGVSKFPEREKARISQQTCYSASKVPFFERLKDIVTCVSRYKMRKKERDLHKKVLLTVKTFL